MDLPVTPDETDPFWEKVQETDTSEVPQLRAGTSGQVLPRQHENRPGDSKLSYSLQSRIVIATHTNCSCGFKCE